MPQHHPSREEQNEDNVQEETSPDPQTRAAHAAYRATETAGEEQTPGPLDTDPQEQYTPETLARTEDEQADAAAEEDSDAPAEEAQAKSSPMQDALDSFRGLGGGRQKELEEENARLKDQLMRALAENDNLRKRAAREKEDLGKFAISGFARDLVGVSENLYRALESVPQDKREGSDELAALAQGVDMTLQELLKCFEQHGIRRIDPEGEPFDHNFHQAVAQVESADHAPGTVMQVVQSGYVIHGRLLRPAMVCVSKAPAGE